MNKKFQSKMSELTDKQNVAVENCDAKRAEEIAMARFLYVRRCKKSGAEYTRANVEAREKNGGRR